MNDLEHQVDEFRRKFFEQLLLDERLSYVLHKPDRDVKCLPNLQLPVDFRLIEHKIGYLTLGCSYVLFEGKKPCLVSDQEYWGYGIDRNFGQESKLIGDLVFLGYDVDGVHYGYDFSGETVKLVCWDGIGMGSPYPCADMTFLNLLKRLCF